MFISVHLNINGYVFEFGRYVEDSYYGDVFVIFVLPDDLSMKRKNKMVKLENEFHHFWYV
ncbi:hypothetical protein BTI21_00285 [Lactobacillus delbrueckii subsp. bulgaricus]|nr:hypothetical protein [Lactobacillus delbrueckii subsp. bulgaricus]MBT8807555.1 hypothetical protein [Lactobacillus delbrueckii subsp. bulgaricus]MBT8832852.1 hypothetical protein [Lactobacillus delbrueckii subsp. bulgaricus]MBT8836027.1 hypothetical protein [Lactobacillus delbrueckii subsp. bulgaricus]MBT8839243.1 hypothetical protein [Lactobacillus delbrueckii subsp. bulgaricus]